ncbi:unnamed protein product [Symbiodinium microadriaticum]|nr:unnamed protein product [Symbiodinium microadriaticum]
MRLIENAYNRGHPAFGRIDLATMRKRAQDLLPEAGVPPEVVAVLPSSDKDAPVEKQKVAAPVAAPATVEEAAVELRLRRPNAVVLEKSCVDVTDYEAQQVAAVQALADVAEEDLMRQDSEQEDGPAPEQDVVSSNQPIDQFAPWYFGVAFAYLFQYCTQPCRTRRHGELTKTGGGGATQTLHRTLCHRPPHCGELVNHTARTVPGTQEARRNMRFEIQGMRARYGTPIFVTVTPDEGHQLLYIRLARHRQSDPIRLAESSIGQRAGLLEPSRVRVVIAIARNAECTNLRAFFQQNDATCAERVCTTQFVRFPGQDYLRYAETSLTGTTDKPRRVTATALGRSVHAPNQRQVADRDHAEFNARRPRDSACWYLSPYEFQLRWEIVPTRAPRSWQEWSSKPRQAWDVELTPAGEAKLRANGDKAVRFIPGQDTQLRSDLPKEVLAFEDSPVNSRIRAAWLLRLRRRPRCPTFGHCPIPHYNQDRVETNSKICLVYFRAWTGLPKSADEDVPHVADLLGTHDTWEAAFRTWLRALPCQETKQHVGNFLSVYRVRAVAQDAENSDNDGAQRYVRVRRIKAPKQLRKRTAEDGRRICNAQQHGFLSRVIERVVQEMRTGEMHSGSREEDPLRWVLHGGPGTGKTHAIKLLRTELFEGILGWQAGVHFQTTALQAVTSDMLDGDTLHHCFGLTWGSGTADQTSLTKGLELAKRLLQMRWLIIDEISMVSLELLARVERAKNAANAGKNAGADDPRFLGHFVGAPSVFATNVRKCHTNKVRAEAFAGRAGRELHYVVAQDRASAAVVREKPNLAQEKLAWLQRHDRECGELCGMLPLCEGMPVFLTDQVNRKRNFKLLKGRKGCVRGWQHATDGAVPAEPGTVVWNELPKAVLVEFPGATFQLPGLAKGVYPITPQRRTWFLDEGRKRPCLAVTRKQLRLLPAFAMTAHQAQGQKDLLILRAFEAELFQQGDQSFRQLLLRHWRSHDLDWAFPGKLLNFHVWQTTCLMCTTKRQCGTCDQWFEESAYTAHGWRTKRDRVCAGCRVALQFQHIGLRSRRRLRRRVEKTRQERRKRVLEAVRQGIETCRKKRRVMCGRYGAKTEAKTAGGLANHVSANKTNDMTCCDTCRRMQREAGPAGLQIMSARTRRTT